MLKISKSWNNYDLVVCFSILTLGVLEFAFSRRAADYLYDINYFELLKSVANHAGYGYNGRPMTQLPPGLPHLLAWLSLAIGSSYTTMIRVMTVFTTSALIASYWLLRSEQDRRLAAITCLLLGSAPGLFAFSTTMVFADMPYFFASTLILCLAISRDKASDSRQHILTWILGAVLLAGTVLLRSAAIALLGGLCCWMAVSFLKEPVAGRRRLKLFLIPVIAGLAAAAGWMSWAVRHQSQEWSIPGYQENYVAQLRLKNANEPELGLATWKDIIVRPISTADDTAAAMLGLFVHKAMAPAWYSPGTLIPLMLVLLGLVHSFRRTGGSLLEWYFVCYQMMFLFWPWDFELRFLLPVAPLAFLYAYRGAHLLWRQARVEPRVVGACSLAFAVVCGLSSINWGKYVSHPSMRSCVAAWFLVAAISVVLLVSGQRRTQKLAVLLAHQLSLGGRSVTIGGLVAALLIGLTCLTGIASQLRLGIANLNTDLSNDDFNNGQIKAAQWIQAHSTPSSVVMARRDDVVYHYSQRRVIWFPPSRDAVTLIDGIRRHHVEYIVVQYGSDTYWRPPAQECFEILSKAYPGWFRLAYAGPNISVFEVSPAARPVHVSAIPEGGLRSTSF